MRCECTVEEGGIRYAGMVYRSLSAAAMAAAKDVGLNNKTQNGFTFWGLSKPEGSAVWAKLSPDWLARALREAIDNPSIRANAASISEKIRAEDGVAHAVREIERRCREAGIK